MANQLSHLGFAGVKANCSEFPCKLQLMGNLEFEIFGLAEMLIGLAGFESGFLWWGWEMDGVNQLHREIDMADYWFHTILFPVLV